MKITLEWWNDQNAEFPVDKSAFDVDDTLKGVLEKAPAGIQLRFPEVLDRMVPDDILKRSIQNNAEFGLCLVSDDVRKAIGRVLFVMNNPHSTEQLPLQPGRNSVDPLRKVQDMMQGVDAAVERIAGETTRGMNVKDLPVSAEEIAKALDDEEDPVRPSSSAFKLPAKEALLGDTREVRSADLKAFLEAQKEKKSESQ